MTGSASDTPPAGTSHRTSAMNYAVMNQNKNNMAKQSKKGVIVVGSLASRLLDFLITQSNDPSELCTNTAQALLSLLSASIIITRRNSDTIKESLRILEDMQYKIVREFLNPCNDSIISVTKAEEYATLHRWSIDKATDWTDVARPDVLWIAEDAYRRGFVKGRCFKFGPDAEATFSEEQLVAIRDMMTWALTEDKYSTNPDERNAMLDIINVIQHRMGDNPYKSLDEFLADESGSFHNESARGSSISYASEHKIPPAMRKKPYKMRLVGRGKELNIAMFRLDPKDTFSSNPPGHEFDFLPKRLMKQIVEYFGEDWRDNTDIELTYSCYLRRTDSSPT